MITIQENVSQLNQTFDRYWRASTRTREESVAKASKNFGMFLYRRLKIIAPEKGAITAQLGARLKSKQHVKVSEYARRLVLARFGVSQSIAGRGSVSNRKVRGHSGPVNLWAEMTKQEIRLREGHRQFTSAAALFHGDFKSKTDSKKKSSTLGTATPSHTGTDGSQVAFEWSNAVSRYSAMAASGMLTEKGRNAFEAAVKDTQKDMLNYIHKKQQESGRNGARNL